MKYPVARKDNTKEVLFGREVADPYRWMEEESKELNQWIDEEIELTQSYLEAIPEREHLVNRLSELYDYDKFGISLIPLKDKVIYSVSEGLNNQPTYYVLNEQTGERRVLISPTRFSEDGSVSAVLGDVSKDEQYITVLLSSSGSDWQEIIVLNIENGEQLEDHIDNVKFSGTSWYKNGFFYERYDVAENQKDLTSVNSVQKVYYHELGTKSDDDVLIYSDSDNPLRFNSLHVSHNEQHLILTISEGTSGTEIRYMHASDLDLENIQKIAIETAKKDDSSVVDAGFKTIVKGFQYNCYMMGGKDDEVFFLTDEGASNKKIVAYNGTTDTFRDLVPESEYFIDGFDSSESILALNMSKDAISHLKIMDLKSGKITDCELSEIGTVFSVAIGKNDSVYYSMGSFLLPTHHYKMDISNGKSEIINAPKLNFSTTDYITEQKFFASKDGTKVPVFITRPKNIKMDGSNPLFLYGYGGFTISITPAFSPANIQMLEHGMIYASVCLRGGLEYGEEWHKGGMLQNKQNVFDDMIAAAEYVIAEGYTKPERMAIHGRSNGGVLVGSTINQRPDLFAVAIPQVGVMDMLRFHKFTIGWGWMAEYGNPDVEEHFNFIYPYSPLHNIKEMRYPATMVVTSDHDDRVVPAHSFKYAATLQEKASNENPVLLRVTKGAGHGAGNAVRKVVVEKADTLAFILNNIR